MRKSDTVEIEVHMTGHRFIEDDTGTYEMQDVEIETAHMFGREWSEKEMRDEFGKLADYIIDWDNGEEWEE